MKKRTAHSSIFEEFKTLYFGSLFIISVIALGTLGYVFLEDYKIIDAVYMTLITISTVGFGEVKALSETGKIFTIGLVMISFGAFGYILTSMVRVFFDGEYKKLIKFYKVRRKINNYSDHIIVCGFGRNGKKATADLISADKKVIVFDQNPAVFEEEVNADLLGHKNLITVVGDASHEETLLKANLETAYSLITTLPNDAENLLIVLTAHQLNPKIKIISRASDDHSYSKLIRAGATNVIMPDIVGGARMARLVTKPNIMEFLDMIMLREGVDVKLEEVVCDDIIATGKKITIANMNLRQKTGISMIGLKTADGRYIFNPDPALPLSSKDRIFVLGKPYQIEKLKKILKSN